MLNPATTDKQNNPSHAAQHANANDAIEAVEAKVGKDSSATTTSHDFKLSGVTGSDKAVSKTGTETLTNKTLTTPKVDTINEETAANGVTVDSLNIKDGKLNTNNSVVTANITDANVTMPKITNPYKASAYRATSSQAISATTWIKVQLNAENYDTNNNFDSTTNYRYTAPVAGYYVVTGAVECDTATRLTTSIYVNGSIKQRGDDVNAGGTISIVAGIIYLAANDYVELYIYSGSANNVVAVQADTNMSIHLLST